MGCYAKKAQEDKKELKDEDRGEALAKRGKCTSRAKDNSLMS